MIELVIERIAYSWSPEELHFQHPYLSLRQIFAALAYYEDHKEQPTPDIETRLEKVYSIQHEIHYSPLIEKLKKG